MFVQVAVSVENLVLSKCYRRIGNKARALFIYDIHYSRPVEKDHTKHLQRLIPGLPNCSVVR